MPETIIIAIISAGLGALVSFVGSIIFKLIEIRSNRKDKIEERKNNNEDKYIEKKCEAYSKALNYLIYLKKTFRISKEEMVNNQETREMVNEAYSEVKNSSAAIRLYASDDVFNFYESLVDKYHPFSFTNKQEKLSEESIKSFDHYIATLSRIMRKDLGYKDIDCDTEDLIVCPKCKNKHPIYQPCKECKLSIFEYLNYDTNSYEENNNK